ncbi:unnamed protein product [Orchesella dallaii]|uniref:ubiquitinyl hydrolase 1 n=1 Tax=Orchesella dallaii TaxID=48710 RepID=A0ABP1RRZ8_9HEXA
MGDIRTSVNEIDGILNASSLQAILPHVFLPKKLPQEGGKEDDVEATLLKSISYFTQKSFLGENAIPRTRSTMHNWEKLQSQVHCSLSLDTELAHLRKGYSTVLYIQEQNCTAIFTKVDEAHMRIMTFRASLPNEEIMSTAGSLQATFPETAEIVPISKLLLSPTFSRHVEVLTLKDCDLAMPTSRKGGQTFKETRQVSSPCIISEFLVGMLQPISQNEYNEVMKKHTSIKISKKIRDEINWENCNLPFRRSGLWMSAKVVLQLSLKEELGNEKDARLAYKIILLQMITHICNKFGIWKRMSHDRDIISQMLVKLARRAQKLSEPSINSKLEAVRKSALAKAFTVIDSLHAFSQNVWNTAELTASKISKVFRIAAEIEEDVQHEMGALKEYLAKAREPQESGSMVNLSELQFKRYPTISELLQQSTTLLSTDKKKDPHWSSKLVWIHDVELFTRTKLTIAYSPKDIYTLLCTYAQQSVKLYAVEYCDPVSFSRMILTVLKMIMTLDSIAVNAHPLLHQYESGIEPKMFEDLLLPHNQEEMEMFDFLMQYFQSRNEATHPSIIHSGYISPSDFSVRYATTSQAMIKLKTKIVSEMESKIQSKKNEIQAAKKVCELLESQINRMECTTEWNNYLQAHTHVKGCVLCSHKTKLSNKRKSVAYYQRPLPNYYGQEYLQDAVVFELLIPEEIAYLRNSLAIFIGELCGQPLFDGNVQDKGMRHTWAESFSGLSSYVNTTMASKCNEVKLGSKKKLTIDSHYTRGKKSKKKLDVMSAYETDFILNNGLSVNFFFKPFLNFKLSEEHLRFQIKNTDKHASYANLQFSLKSPRPTENEVIALQYICHEKLPLREFITYGSMRSGLRIQLRNLYAAIANQSIAFEQESVLALILQTIWEVGPTSKENLKEIHADFYEKEFSLEFIQQLEHMLKSNATNWSSPMVIMAVIVLTIRVLELNENEEVQSSCSRLLKQIREILEDWWKKLENITLNSEGSSGSTNDMVILNGLLLQTALCSAYTFNVFSTHLLPYVLTDEKDVTFWLRTLSRMYHLVVREKTHERCSKFLQNLLRHARLNISLNIEAYLHTEIGRESLNDFSSQWTGAASSQMTEASHYGGAASNVYLLKYRDILDQKIHTVHIEILRGIFLVDGHPPSYLPENIIQHPLFNEFFQHCRLRVQRDSRTLRTIHKYEDNHYEFFFSKHENNLIIRELHKGYSFELLPHHLFTGKVSPHFINDFTHWLNIKTNEVYFRPKISPDATTKEAQFILAPHNQNMVLRDYPTQAQFHRYVLSINSQGFKHIVKNLSLLETEEFIDIKVEINKNGRERIIRANLRRLNLTFELQNEDGLLYSKNFPGYYISTDQCLQTFTGLEGGILIEKKSYAEASGLKKLFLIQHGDIKIQTDRNKSHQSVSITSTTLRKPPILNFEVDQILHRLKAGNDKSAWLYLAALHASTSSPFPDTFTGLTGTEMALWILQSGLVWSCSPFDEESLRTLEMIRNLSPHRVYYPEHLEEMQTTIWPVGLEQNSYAAFDGYSIIVDYLISCSKRLSGLFPHSNNDLYKQVAELSKSSVPKLRERAYYRHLNLYNGCAHLEEIIVGPRKHNPVFHAKSLRSVRNMSGGWMQLAKVRMSGMSHFLPQKTTVSSLIMTSEMLPFGTDDTISGETFNVWFQTAFRDNWLRLYALAYKVKLNPNSYFQHEFTLLLGALLYSEKVSLEQAINLHNISCRPTPASFTPPLVISSWYDFTPALNSYRAEDVDRIFELRAKEFQKNQYEFPTLDAYEAAKLKYNEKRNAALKIAKVSLKRCWPAPNLGIEIIQKILSEEYADLDLLTKEISSKFGNWFHNRELKLFVEKVDLELEKARRDMPNCNALITTVPRQPGTMRISPIADKADEIEMFFQTPFEIHSYLHKICTTGKVVSLEGKSKMEQRQHCVEIINTVTEILHDFSCVSKTWKALNQAGKKLRFAPVIILRSLLDSKNSSVDVQEYAGTLAVIFSHLKRLNRIIYFERDPKTYSVELEREMKNVPFENWSPAEYPEWLLLELELDVTIRAVQVRVAKHMMNMSGNGVKNGVTQLNMGEGKTSVIVPMIVSKLSSNEDMICRVTVLSSIFTTNFNLLSFTIGGLLNRRLYTVPCRRDCKIFEFLPQIQQAYDECMKHKGVIMTLPEYRLSFRLMMYNYYLQKKYASAFQVYNIEKWLRQHVRDIVDESDEIFSVKYQLIYTTGHQLNIDGGNMRWVVCQKLLQILPKVASQLFDKFGPNIVEFNKKEAKSNSEQFTHFRILNNECKHDFHGLIADTLLDGKVDLLGIILKKQERALVKAFLVDENISEDDHNLVKKFKGIDEEKKLILLLVSGYLRRGVFFSAFSKRWRVEYGVNNKGDKLMAVPFRAKDVAAERTEFGHPDMAIVLTQLSYYYSGLDDEQLYEAFAILKKLTGPEKVYNGWMKAIPETKNINDSIKTYRGMNLLDYEQRNNHLFPILRKHKLVIDFWLENVVFPKESKQFPGKLVMNAWDLCYEKQKHPTTGFSGTNDSSLLLPATISQQDLEELKKTNDELETTIQRRENQCKRYFEMGVTCNTILDFMRVDKLRVLIDAGALMLELGNEALAQRWLDKDRSLEGVVYFTSGNELVIKTRADSKENRGVGVDTPLKLSSYRDQLENCAVYLDDYHTRGTDLKLPTNFKACVTIGSRMRRDNLVQACMRMRKLGKGQSVQFYLSHEANNKIKEMKKNIKTGDKYSDVISVKDILLWVGRNSREFEEDGLPYWAASARNYTQKLAADEMFEMAQKKSTKAGEILAKQCEDPEIFDLQTIYGTYKTKQLLADIIPKWFSHVEEKLKKDGAPGGRLIKLAEEIQSIISMYKSLVQKQIQKHIPNQEYLFSMLEEEQEKELEPEQERQVNVQRPSRATAIVPKMHQNVKFFVKLGGQLYNKKGGFVKLSDIFRKTKFCNIVQPDHWKGSIFATEDFLNVIVSNAHSKLDSFLRPMTYIASWSPPSSSTAESMLLLSAFEVNELMPLFRSRGKEEAVVTLHMFTGRYMEGQDILVNKPRLQLPLSRQGVQLNERMMAPFLIAAGNLFFASMEEQIAFASFLGLLPRPWEDEVEAAFNSGFIEKTGFVKPNSKLWLCLDSLFERDPSGMVRAILKCRNDVLRDSDHTVRLLNQCAYILELEQAEE